MADNLLVINGLSKSFGGLKAVQNVSLNVADPEQTVTVRIETEPAGAEAAETFATDDPAFGIWRDRDETADVGAYLRLLRAPRFSVHRVRESQAQGAG